MDGGATNVCLDVTVLTRVMTSQGNVTVSGNILYRSIAIDYQEQHALTSEK